jgi:hypothetical protein
MAVSASMPAIANTGNSKQQNPSGQADLQSCADPVVCVDLLSFRDQFWERLMANVGIVLVFGAFYLRFNPL